MNINRNNLKHDLMIFVSVITTLIGVSVIIISVVYLGRTEFLGKLVVFILFIIALILMGWKRYFSPKRR